MSVNDKQEALLRQISNVQISEHHLRPPKAKSLGVMALRGQSPEARLHFQSVMQVVYRHMAENHPLFSPWSPSKGESNTLHTGKLKEETSRPPRMCQGHRAQGHSSTNASPPCTACQGQFRVEIQRIFKCLYLY